MMRSKLDEPQILSFSESGMSRMTKEDLFKLNVKEKGVLKLKRDFEDRLAVTAKLGKTEHWSSDGLYRHLCVLQKLVPRTNAATSRAWIDSFFFRASAMVPQGEQLILNLEQGKYINYTAIRTSVLVAGDFLTLSRLGMLKDHNHNYFFVSEAKTDSISLEDHVPQVVGEMYACAEQLNKDIIRRAVTTGHEWIFLILKMNYSSEGAKYAQSLKRIRLMTVTPPDTEKPSRTMCEVIAGIIAYWIEHSDEDIGDDDWFNVKWHPEFEMYTSL